MRATRSALSTTASESVMEIVDDGVGFEAIGGREGSYGLITMRERAERLGGCVCITSMSGAGTQIVVRMPLLKPATTVAEAGAGHSWPHPLKQDGVAA